ncbi:MAG: hypothetical protein HY825_15720 [Acidobacteria bacterium]|nr:hypothetical protein [Acidobacteriota bacterium]
MKKTMSVRLVGLTFVLALAAGQAWAQTAKVDVPFSFMVAKKEMPAGEYELRVDGAEVKRMTLRNLATGEKAQATVMFRLANIGAAEPNLAFDVAEGMHYLSEVHFPNSDGFALAGAPGGEHKHEKVKAKS